jgi:release factor glutamine methyltransferase
MKLLEVLEKTAAFFKDKAVESPRLQAELLIAHVLSLPRLSLYLQFERELSEAELDVLRPLVKRRGQREPLQHLLGTTEFYGLKLKCSPAALIPRPETEGLVERLLAAVKDLPPGLIYDVGTGTGAIALALAQNLPAWKIKAIDVSPEALALARENAETLGISNVEFVQGNLLEGQTEPAAAVAANLPYLNASEMAGRQPEVGFDPALALAGGEDGLDLIRRLLPQAAPLAPAVFLEIGPGQAQTAQSLLQEQHYGQARIENDLTDRPRYAIGTPPSPGL